MGCIKKSFIPKQKTSINTKMACKWELSLGNLLENRPKYESDLSNLAGIMDFSSFDVARQHLLVASSILKS